MKRTPSELAILGGAPAFAAPLHVGRPNLGDRSTLMRRIDEILDRRWLTNGGPMVAEFEERIAELAGVSHCIVLSNATVALEVLARALELSGEVIVPAFTFVASAHALTWVGLEPVFCDVDERSHNLDPARVEELVTPRTSAILGVHLWGRAADTAALEEIAARRGLRLFFDAAHALGCTARGIPIGGAGDAEVFSFHATKFVNSFEGGAIVTNDAAIARRVRHLMNFGFAGYDHVVSLGTNGKMTEVAAAMGLTSLESMPEFIESNRCNYATYRRELENVPGISFVEYDPSERSSYQYVIVEVDEQRAGIGRDELYGLLWAENILARRYFYPGCHRMAPYNARAEELAQRLPVTERVASRVLALPTGTAVGQADIEAVCQVIRFAQAHAPALRDVLATSTSPHTPALA